MAARFFPFSTYDGQILPLCERDYFRRLDLVCDSCHEALRGAYIIAGERKYHTDHFSCSLCTTHFGPNDSYYEHNGQFYCHFHYTTRFAAQCCGCDMAILKQYVEINRMDVIEHWHPECFMIHKYWNVKVAVNKDAGPQQDDSRNSSEYWIALQRETEEKVYRIWTVLSAFEGKTTSSSNNRRGQKQPNRPPAFCRIFRRVHFGDATSRFQGRVYRWHLSYRAVPGARRSTVHCARPARHAVP